MEETTDIFSFIKLFLSQNAELKHGAMLRWVKEIKEESKSEDGK